MKKCIIISIASVIILLLFIWIHNTFYSEDVNVSHEDEQHGCVPPISPYFYIKNNLDDLKFNHSSADLVLIINGTKIAAHKVLLAAHSRVFEELIIAAEQKKTNQLVLAIENIDMHVITDLLVYFYTNTLRNPTQRNDDLLVIADRFGVETLKCSLENSFMHEINIENAAPLLFLAIKANATHLKYKSSDFILKNLKSVVNTKLWKILSQSNPHLMTIAADTVGFYPRNYNLSLNCLSTYDTDHRIMEKLKEFFYDEKFADVILELNNRTVAVNRAFLNGQNAVFQKILNQADADRQLIKIAKFIELKGDPLPEMFEIDDDTLMAVLLYVYTGSVPIINKTPEKILVAAQVFGLDNLKCVSENILITMVKNNNVANLLLIADKTNAVELKAICIDFIIKNLNEVVKTDGWIKLSKTHPELMTKSITAVFSR